MNEIQLGINQHDLAQLVHLLELAQSSDNSKQTEVYSTLKNIQEHPISYLYLAYLFANHQLTLNMRKMAGLTLSSALKRNCSTIHFQASQLSSIKYLLLEQTNQDLSNIRSMIISNLINKQNFDYQLFNYLIDGLSINPQHIGMINVILQDLKFNSENYSIFEQTQFITALQKIYKATLAIAATQTSEVIAQNIHFQQYIKCLNLLTFHCPKKMYHYLSQYLHYIIQPILRQYQISAVNEELVRICLEGINQIAATKFSLITKELTLFLVSFSPVQGATAELMKCWTNIMIEFIQNDDQNSNFTQYLPIVLPKAIKGLTFTIFDQRNIKQQMQVEYNPYHQESADIDAQNNNEQSIYQASYGSTSGYTLRKLSFQLIQKISINYSEQFWNNWHSLIIQQLQSQQSNESETAICLLGIIAQTCMYDMTEHIEKIVMFIIDKAGDKWPSLVRATSLWTLEKLFAVYKENQRIVVDCLRLIFTGILQHCTEGTHTTQLMLKQASISFLDQIISQDTVCPAINQQIFIHIIQSLTYGLNLFKGRALFNIFKALSSIFQNQHFNIILSHQLCSSIISQLCKKWSNCQKNDSVMCPLLQCLITGCEGKRLYFQPYYLPFFNQILPLLKLTNRKQLILRCIDFMSSIINGGHQIITPIVTSPAFLEQVYTLATSQQKQIRHFTYGLISDITKKYDIAIFAQKFIILIAHTMSDKYLASQSNALMCLTDLLTTYSSLTAQYVSDILERTVDIISKQKLQSVFALNFARIFGRLSFINPQCAKNIILANPKLIGFLFQSLRTRQVTKITNDSFIGIITTIGSFTAQQVAVIASDLQSVVQTLVCYPIRREESAQNQLILSYFIQFLRQLRQKMGQSNWQQLLKCPIFLPGALKTIKAWLS